MHPVADWWDAMSLTLHQLKQRKKHIGSSEVAALFGLSPYTTLTELYHDKANPDVIPDQTGNASTQAGNFWEDAIIKYARQELGIKGLVSNQFRTETAKTDGILSATYDAISSKENLAVEAKYSIQHDRWGDPADSEIVVPEEYMLQCQAQALVSNLDRVLLIRLKPTFYKIDFDVYEILPDAEIQQAIIERAVNFWRFNVEARNPPTSDPPPMELLKAMKREPKKIIEMTGDDSFNAQMLIQQYDLANNEESTANKEKERHKAQLVDLLGDAEIAKLEDGSQYSFKSSTTNRFDTAAFKKAHPDLYKQFTKTTTSPRFHTKVAKQ